MYGSYAPHPLNTSLKATAHCTIFSCKTDHESELKQSIFISDSQSVSLTTENRAVCSGLKADPRLNSEWFSCPPPIVGLVLGRPKLESMGEVWANGPSSVGL